VLRVARTIADLAGAQSITPPHIAEALALRQLDRKRPLLDLGHHVGNGVENFRI
jgi:hypothetical protein